jgi:hypothetical protein
MPIVTIHFAGSTMALRAMINSWYTLPEAS